MKMTFEQAKEKAYISFIGDLRRDNSGKGYVCPICGSGSGKKGTGITENPQNKGHFTCWAGCFTNADVFDIEAVKRGFPIGSGESIRAVFERYGIETERNGRKGGYTENTAQTCRNETETTEREEHEETPLPCAEEKHVSFLSYFAECNERIKAGASEALRYLSFRGLSERTANSFMLGYDPEWRSPTALKNGKNPPPSPRLIIPTSESSYIARDIRQGVGTFSKMKEGRAELFNAVCIMDGDNRPVFITEGEIDALSVIEAGGCALALGSTSNARKLLALLEEQGSGKTFILCLDNDSAGQKATETLSQGFRRLNISHITANISGEHKDPNEALTADKEAFTEAIRNAETITASKPDNTKLYIEQIMTGELSKFAESAERVTGFENLDREAGGIYAGLYALGAISSLGKTTLLHQIADQMAGAGAHVLYFSLEQSRLELVSKSLARITAQADVRNAVSSLAIRKGYFPASVRNAAKEYTRRVNDRMSIIEGNFACNVSFIGEYVRKYIEQNGAKPVVMIDYLQILQGNPAHRQSTKETVDDNVTELKRLSRELDLPVFVISSINRSNYLAPVDFESFKESGGIEYTADVVWGLQLDIMNDEIFSKEKNVQEKRDMIREAKAASPRRVELVCLKNRFGVSSYRAGFDYYPQYDLFIPAP